MTGYLIEPHYEKKTILKTLCRVFVFLGAAAVLAWAPPESGKLYAADVISVPGITEPIVDVTLSSTLAGTVARILVREGETVSRGAVILEMDSRLDVLEVERRKLIWESKHEVEAAAARVATLAWLLESNRELFKTTASVSKEEIEKMILDHRLAVAEHQRLTDQEERERIEYEMARESLLKRSLVAPARGTVIKIFLDEGEGFEENQPLAHVVDTSRGLFVCNAEEWIGRAFKRGQTVDLRINTGKKTAVLKGKTIFVSPVVDPASGLLEVKVEFENHDGLIRPGVTGFLLIRK